MSVNVHAVSSAPSVSPPKVEQLKGVRNLHQLAEVLGESDTFGVASLYLIAYRYLGCRWSGTTPCGPCHPLVSNFPNFMGQATLLCPFLIV
jgi:hypothetical protein